MSDTVKSYRDLHVWQKGIGLVKTIDELRKMLNGLRRTLVAKQAAK